MYTVKRAIIMAAGKGERLKPITLKTPKPLVKVCGTRIIDSIICGLLSNGIHEIYIVVGYLKEMFLELEREYKDVNLIVNPYFNFCNNISSLYMARDYLEESIIIDGDQIIYNSAALTAEFQRSGYNCVWVDKTFEWLLRVENGLICSCSKNIAREGGWRLYGISRWSKEDGEKLKRHLEVEFEVKKNCQIYWDEVPLFLYADKYQLGIKEMESGDVIEIDSIEELVEIDRNYRDDYMHN